MSLVARIAYFISLIVLLAVNTTANAAAHDNDVEKLRIDWAMAKYRTPKDQQIAALEKVIHEAETLNSKHPHQPEVMVWYATSLSSYAQLKGGMGVLPHVKKARDLLESSIGMDSHVTNGFAQGVLGALYARVPGWPIAFGDKTKARSHLQTAIQIDPQGSDSNYYYGDFLLTVGEYADARRHLEIAQHAPIRQGYEIQDRGRKGEIAASLAKLKHLGH
jgi:tetratricopeptide (TPR) repeat protein